MERRNYRYQKKTAGKEISRPRGYTPRLALGATFLLAGFLIIIIYYFIKFLPCNLFHLCVIFI